MTFKLFYKSGKGKKINKRRKEEKKREGKMVWLDKVKKKKVWLCPPEYRGFTNNWRKV